MMSSTEFFCAICLLSIAVFTAPVHSLPNPFFSIIGTSGSLSLKPYLDAVWSPTSEVNDLESTTQWEPITWDVSSEADEVNHLSATPDVEPEDEAVFNDVQTEGPKSNSEADFSSDKSAETPSEDEVSSQATSTWQTSHETTLHDPPGSGFSQASDQQGWIARLAQYLLTSIALKMKNEQEQIKVISSTAFSTSAESTELSEGPDSSTAIVESVSLSLNLDLGTANQLPSAEDLAERSTTVEPTTIELSSTLVHQDGLPSSTSSPTTTQNPDVKKPTLLFVILVFLYLPVVTTLSRLLQSQTRRANVGCAIQLILNVGSLTLVMVIFLLDKGENRGLASILSSVYGVIWAFLTLASVISGIGSTFRFTRFQKFWKMSTFCADLALVSACLMEAKYHFFAQIEPLLGFRISSWDLGGWLTVYFAVNTFILLQSWYLKNYGPHTRQVQPLGNSSELDPEQGFDAEEEAENLDISGATLESLKCDLAQTHTYVGGGDRPVSPSCVIQMEDD